MKKFLGLVLAAVLTLSFGAGSALADTLLDPQIVVCQSCSSAPGGDPNIITNTSLFNMFIEGNHASVSPTLVMIAQYNGGSQPTVSLESSSPPIASVPLATVGTFHLMTNTFVGYNAITGAGSNDVFDVVGLNSGGSLNFGNLAAADVLNGFVAPTSFTLFVYALPTGLNPGVQLDTSAANGSFIFGYGCLIDPGFNSPCTPGGNVAQTVMTNAGIVGGHRVPEPGSLLLLGTGLAGLGLWGWKNRRSVQA